MSKRPNQEQRFGPTRRGPASEELEPGMQSAKAASSGGRIQSGQGPVSAGALMQMQRSMGNRDLGRWLKNGSGSGPSGSAAPLQRKENRTGMPDRLKSGVEQLSGMSLDDVQVHYNSGKPAEMDALAYAQGTDIYVGPGQEKHLPHEAWHVVQQREGRVAPTMEHNGQAINDEHSLESEADSMGAKALQAEGSESRGSETGAGTPDSAAGASGQTASMAGAAVAQRKVVDDGGDEVTIDDIIEYFAANGLEQGISDRDLKREFNKESEKDRELTIEQFLNKINAFGESESEEDADDDWDPADYAAEPMDPDGILSSDVRKSLSFNSNAKAYMKLDTPKDKSGHYICHICHGRIQKGESVDMDHLPPWKERLHAYIDGNGLTEDDHDELTGPDMKHLYNMRGSVFAHSSCNRGHSGEGNYKKKWKNALNWYQSGGGAPF